MVRRHGVTLKDILESVRKAALPGIWSLGVKLAREQTVSLERADDQERILRVRTSDRPVPATVVLYVSDLEWTCDCDGRVDPCAHVVAATIALGQAEQKGTTLAAARETEAVVAYRFARRDGKLAFERYLVRPGRPPEIIKGSLASLLVRAGADVPIHPTHEDLSVDRIVAHWQPGFLAPDRTADLFEILAAAADVALDGEPIKTSGERVFPEAIVEDDAGGGVALRVDRDPRISEVVHFGVVRCGDTLHVIGETGLSGARLERLPLTRPFAREQLGMLVTQVLPELKRKIPVAVRTRRLPKTTRGEAPRIAMDLSHREHTLSVLPTLVYGDPPRARIDNGEMTHLGGTAPVRDEAAEKRLVLRLRDELDLVTGRRVDFDGAEAIRFAEKLRRFQGHTDDEPGMVDRQALVPHLTMRGDAFDLVFDSSESDRTASAEAVLRSWRDGLGLVPLDGGGWAPLPGDWLERFGHVVADLLAARREDGTVSAVALPSLAELCDGLDQPRPPGFEKLAPLLEGFEGIPEAALPDGLQATLRSYQRSGVDWLCFLRNAELGAILADDMGLGKTLQALCAVRGRVLVVCPKSVVYNWAAEIRRFVPALTASIYHGGKRTLDEGADITLTTYAVLRLDAVLLAKEEWDVIVIDEAQAIKNPDSQTARAAYGLRGRFRVALTGTPVENRLEELWSLFHFTNPGLLGGRSDFRDRYEGPIASADAGALGRLRSRIRPFLLRRLKRDVAPELPPRTDVVLHCELDDAERDVYEAVRAAARKEVVSALASGGSVLAALEALLRLRQAACHPALVPGQTAECSSKIERLLEALEEAAADGHKALVFSQWTSLLDLVEPHLDRAGIAFTRLDGKTQDREGVVNDFQSPDGPPVMLVSLKAGGTGLNLTAADHVFLLDPWWNPKVEDQAADRAHRIGQDRPVMVYRMVAKDTVEEGILALQDRKRQIADAALGEAEQAQALTRADLLALLS
jgi:superfamily II DNA or RNA helicase